MFESHFGYDTRLQVRLYLSLNSTLMAGRVPWPEFAQLAARVGFRGVDVNLDPALSAGVPATRRLLDELKIRPAIVDFPVEFRKDDAAFRASLPKLEETAPFAAAIGCPRMITWLLSSSQIPKDEQLYLAS